MTRPEMALIRHNDRMVGHSESARGTPTCALAIGNVDGVISQYR
jgi:hypothetical protein